MSNPQNAAAMLSDKMLNALNGQVNAELWSAYLYLAMSLDAESKALRGVSNWFYVQWLEEQDHARILQNYVADNNLKVNLQPIDAVPDTWPGALEMFESALEHEMKVTSLIRDLVRLAMSERDYATLSRLQWFVDEQVEEEKSVREIIDALEAGFCFSGQSQNCCSGCALRDLDKELAARCYRRAEPLNRPE